MARRRKITAPSAEDMDRMEQEFRRETPLGPGAGALAPIAQVAAETAGSYQPDPPELREAQARDSRDASLYRKAEEGGLLMIDLPLGEVDEGVMVRDRTVIDPSEMEELKRSIQRNGLRLPIEVYDKGEGSERRFGLISGYRRLRAVRDLNGLMGPELFATIRAVVREPEELGGALVAMVEENEIRAQLTHFERGRIAVVAARQDSFGSVEEAVNTLFASASKAKRSKIRSFALVYEELGDMLDHAEALKEKDGLRLATALRQGAEPPLREALEAGPFGTAAEEWAALEAALDVIEADQTPVKSRGGRPKSAKPGTPAGWVSRSKLRLSNGIEIAYGADGDGHVLKISGKGVDRELMEAAMAQLAHMLEKP
ncbi:ParB/RepB/Spo0J family partition protein [Palleronia abyssalis]|uniref:Nucleoid occlusion protein n=1 Tax=Palleronia abyssalis TaxID=1501240 RepID=A0A2R8C1C3_9RHOB|nr:ParB N-terminal domain-containing protein [Palleronia abyssalis]SPJ26214.1 Nucleoid occlusion protein [Palleronia abyssalis]